MDDLEFYVHARTALPEACDVIDALCDLLDEDWYHSRPPEGECCGDAGWPDWITIALARKQAKEGKGGTIDEVSEEL